MEGEVLRRPPVTHYLLFEGYGIDVQLLQRSRGLTEENKSRNVTGAQTQADTGGQLSLVTLCCCLLLVGHQYCVEL